MFQKVSKDLKSGNTRHTLAKFEHFKAKAIRGLKHRIFQDMMNARTLFRYSFLYNKSDARNFAIL
jgi:hypothetical protein